MSLYGCNMTKSTSNILQLETNLNEKITLIAAKLHCHPNDLINEVVRLFVDGQERIKNLEAQEAKRQFLLANKENNPDADLWLKHNEESWLDEWK